MMKKPLRPFYEVKHEYEASLKNFCEAATMLYGATRTVVQLADRGADPSKLIETLKEHVDRFEKATHHIEGK